MLTYHSIMPSGSSLFDIYTFKERIRHSDIEDWCRDNLPELHYTLRLTVRYDSIRTTVQVWNSESAVAFKLMWMQ